MSEQLCASPYAFGVRLCLAFEGYLSSAPSRCSARLRLIGGRAANGAYEPFGFEARLLASFTVGIGNLEPRVADSSGTL